MKKFFGTDGIRGKSNQGIMAPDSILRLAISSASLFSSPTHHSTVVIAKDTRLSGYMVESSLMAGFVSMGMDVMLAGVLPTPALAMLTRSLRACLGVMISASHNPYYDNGIKFFGPNGVKLEDQEEKKLEEVFVQNNTPLISPDKMGKAYRLDDAGGRYIEFVKSSFPKGLRLDGLKIVVDCANGANYKIAPKVFWELGAEVIPFSATPNGVNINEDCGAASPFALQKAVLDHQADIGIALDGDGDRVIMVDEKGQVLDGDQLIGLIACSWKELNLLKSDTIVTTHMSNLGLERYLNGLGLNLFRTNVGDRHVFKAMQTFKSNVGGEQSGHIILTDYAATGDGILAALQILSLLVRTQKPLSTLGRVFEPVPQILKNVPLDPGSEVTPDTIQKLNEETNLKLANKGKILIRMSGTEPLLRLMAQGDDEALLKEVMYDIMRSLNVANNIQVA